MKGPVTRGVQCFILLAILLPGCMGCRALRAPAGEPQSLTPERAVRINSGVRAFMGDVAYDVTKNGPAAWQKHFIEGPEFFMAANGNWVFQSGATAATGVATPQRFIPRSISTRTPIVTPRRVAAALSGARWSA